MTAVSGRRQRRRRCASHAAVVSALALAVVAILTGSWRSRSLGFVGQAPTPRAASRAIALRAEKTVVKGKKKQKLSLKEALQRQKEKMKEQDEKKQDAKLAPEETFYEGPPSSTELFFPFLSCFLVIGIIPFIAAVNRQFRVKYKVTDRRVSVTSGWDGKDVTEFSYQEIFQMNYGLRYLGYCADMRIDLRDGAKVELFGFGNFYDNYEYIYQRLDKDSRKRSDIPPGRDQAKA